MSPEPLTVLHTSDYQVGRPYLPEAADAMIRLAEEVQPDVVVANSLCVLRVGEDALDVLPYLRRPASDAFEPLETRTFELGARKARVPRTPDEAKVES